MPVSHRGYSNWTKGRGGYRYCPAGNAHPIVCGGITTGWLAQMFWPHYSWEKAQCLAKEHEIAEREEGVASRNGKQRLSKLHRMRNGLRRGRLLSVQFNKSVDLINQLPELARDVFSNPAKRRRVKGSVLSHTRSLLPQGVTSLLAARSVGLQTLWQVLQTELALVPLATEVIAGVPSIKRATAVDLDALDEQTGEHCLFEIKTGNTGVNPTHFMIDLVAVIFILISIVSWIGLICFSFELVVLGHKEVENSVSICAVLVYLSGVSLFWFSQLPLCRSG